MPSSELLVTLFSTALPLFVIAVIVAYSLRILREYERGVVFLLGRFWKVKGPGLVIIVPFIQQIVRMDLRTRVLDVPPQDVISKDNVSVRVNAVVYFCVMDAEKAVIQVEDYEIATSQFAQTTLRSVAGQHDFDEMLAEREKVNAEVQRILDARTYSWGIKVSNVELKQIDLNETMTLAYCWSHLRRKFYEVYVGGHSPIATEALARIKQLYAIEDEVRGLPPELRRRTRQDRSKPIVEAPKPFFQQSLAAVPRAARSARRSPTASTIGTASPASSTSYRRIWVTALIGQAAATLG